MAETNPTGQPGPMREGEFTRLTQNKAVTFALDRVPPPSSLYVGADDQLQLLVWNSLNNVTLTLRTRLLRADGNIQPSKTTVVPTTTRAQFVTTVGLTEGYLLSAEVLAEPGPSVRRGQCFCAAQIIKGGASVGENYAPLFADYAATQCPIGWPGGNIRQSVEGPGIIRAVAVSSPAAGLEMATAVPTNARWRPISWRIVLNTAVAVANRTVAFAQQDTVGTSFRIDSLVTQAASLTQRYVWSSAPVRSAAAEANILLPMPPGMYLTAGMILTTVSTNLQAADQYSSDDLLVEEWIET